MSSKTGVEGSWSLTGRLTAIFAATTSALIALYALWSAHFVYSSKLDAIHSFMEHETQELAMLIARTSASHEEIVLATDSIADVSDEPPCAFRVRDRDGQVIAESGVAHLLARPVVAMSWREAFFGQPAASLVTAEPVHALTVEVVADVSEYIDDIQAYLMSSVVAFLVAVVLAGLAGWFTADRGLRGLHEVVHRAGHVDFPSRGVTLDMAGAPREVRDVGVALEDMIRRIDDGLVRMRTFTAGLAHELRSPLQSLIGRTEVALLRERSPSEYEQALRGNLDDLHELSDAVDNMVALCRTATPDRHTQPTQAFDLAAESRLRLEREQRSAERSGVSVEIFQRGDTSIVADREACLRVVRNLVSNAIVWSPVGGCVRVEITDEGADVGLQVDDEGPGIPADLADKVFEPFVSGRARSGRRGSYGLGLAICKSVVGEHGGSIRFEPRPQGGTRFLVRLPRQPRPEPVDGLPGASDVTRADGQGGAPAAGLSAGVRGRVPARAG